MSKQKDYTIKSQNYYVSFKDASTEEYYHIRDGMLSIGAPDSLGLRLICVKKES